MFETQATATLRFPPTTARVVPQLTAVAGEWQALQTLQKELSSSVERLGDIFLTATEISRTFGVTRTTLNRLAVAGRVRRKGRRRKRFCVRDALLAVLNLAEGRLRRRHRAATALTEVVRVRNSSYEERPLSCSTTSG